MKRTLRVFCAAAFTALLGAALFNVTHGTLRAQQNTVIQTETRVVLVDTIVTGKKGEYIRDLTAKDFKVFEDNKEQTIKNVSLEAAGSANAQPRYLVLFVDSAAIEAGDAIQVQQSVSSFIDANVGPNRMMSVVNYNGNLRVAQKFTDDAGRLKDALKAVSSSGGARGVTSAATDLRARDMLRALGDLSRSLNTLPGRKIVVLLTGGLAATVDQRIVATSTVEAANMSGVAIYPIDARPVSVARAASGVSTADASSQDAAADRSAFGGGRSRGGLSGAPQGANADSSTNGACTGGRRNTPCQDQESQEILYALSNGTGGFVIKNSSAMVGELPAIGKEQDQYYVLSYAPPESKEGSCHTLKVKVARGGTSVRSRSNYCTVKPLDLLAGTTAGKELESRAAGSQAGSIAASIQLPYFYTSSGVARVNVAMEIMPDALKFENQKGKLHAEINLLGIASAPDGGVGARFSDAVKLDFESQAQVDKLKGKPVHYEKEFKIAPGKYSFTMVFSSGGANFGKLEMPLAVDPWKAEDLALSSLVLSREAHPGSDLDLGLAGALAGDRTPLVAEDIQVVPSGSNQFMKSEPVFFYFEVYLPNSTPVGGHVRILDRKTGESKWDSGRVALSGPHQGGNLPVDMLAAGSYQLEVAAGDFVDKQVKRVMDFEIK
jgi:VWFA-related protein